VITLTHGAGGTVMQELIKRKLLKALRHDETSGFEVPLEDLDDAAVVRGIVFTTDSYTVKPLFFPGGDIGSLAVAGTVNDISMMGGTPVALSLALMIEEGFAISDLERILQSVDS